MNQDCICLKLKCNQPRILSSPMDFELHKGHEYKNFLQFQQEIRDNQEIKQVFHHQELISDLFEKINTYVGDMLLRFKKQIEQAFSKIQDVIKVTFEQIYASNFDQLKANIAGIDQLVRISKSTTKPIRQKELSILQEFQLNLEKLIEEFDEHLIKIKDDKLHYNKFKRNLSGGSVWNELFVYKALDTIKLSEEIKAEKDITDFILDFQYLLNKCRNQQINKP